MSVSIEKSIGILRMMKLECLNVIIEASTEVPEEEYEVEYVYGYRAFDCRQNL